MIKIKKNKSYIFFIILSCLLIILSYTFFCDETKAAVSLELSGEGTEADPYKIYNYEDLTNFSDYVNSGGITTNKYFEILNNLRIERPFSVIGISRNFSFKGHFNGNGHSITIANRLSTSGSFGLFGYTSNATIKNLLIAGNTIVSGDAEYVGGLVGNIIGSGTIIGCANISTNISSNGLTTGGLVGCIEGSVNIINSFNNSNITVTNNNYGDLSVGGIVGEVKYGSLYVNECFNNGNITARKFSNQNFAIAGGIVGKGNNTNSTNVSNSYNKGTIKAENSTYTTRPSSVRRTLDKVNSIYIQEEISSPLFTKVNRAISAGIIGQNGTATNCYNTGNISGGFVESQYHIWYYFQSKLNGYGPFITEYVDSVDLVLQAQNFVDGITGANCSWSNCYSIGELSHETDAVQTPLGDLFTTKVIKVMGRSTVFTAAYDKNSRQAYIYFVPGYGRSYFDLPITNLEFKSCTNTNITASNLGDSFASNPLINNGYPYIKNMFWLNAQEPFN